MDDIRVLYELERTFKRVGIKSTISMLESERRQHTLKIVELSHDGSCNSLEIKDMCKGYIEYINHELRRLESELKDTYYDH